MVIAFGVGWRFYLKRTGVAQLMSYATPSGARFGTIVKARRPSGRMTISITIDSPPATSIISSRHGEGAICRTKERRVDHDAATQLLIVASKTKCRTSSPQRWPSSNP